MSEEKNNSAFVNKRRHKRTKVELFLVVSDLFNQDCNKINIDSPIEVVDVSKSGIGFTSKSILPIGYFFNATLQLGSEGSLLYSVVKIIRCEALDDEEYSYGCEFVGMAPILDFVFDNLEAEAENR